MKILKLSVILAGFFMLATTYCGANDSDGRGDEDDFGLSGDDMKIDKAQVSQMVEMMRAQGQISNEDAEKAQKELSQKSDADMANLQKEAENRVKSGNIPKLPEPTKNERSIASMPGVSNGDDNVVKKDAADEKAKDEKAKKEEKELKAVAKRDPAESTVIPAAKKEESAQNNAANERAKNLQNAFQFINQK